MTQSKTVAKKIEFDNGKYTLIYYSDYTSECLRYGEPWRDITGDNLIYWMKCRIEELESEIANLKATQSKE